jgi:tRNA G18 (ribose-2'-O)-methylase SpoU
MYNVKEKYQHLSPDEIRKAYESNASNVAVGCLNLSGDINIGMMIRSSTIYSVKEFFIIGRKKYDKRSSVGTNHHIAMNFIRASEGISNEFLNIDRIREFLLAKMEEYTIIFIEQHQKSIKLPNIHSIKMDKPPLFIFGNEADGIPVELLEMNNTYSVEIPQSGIGRSLNVACACSIVLYEWFRE